MKKYLLLILFVGGASALDEVGSVDALQTTITEAAPMSSTPFTQSVSEEEMTPYRILIA